MLFPKGKPKRLSGRILNSVFSVASSKTFLGSLRLLVWKLVGFKIKSRKRLYTVVLRVENEEAVDM